VALVTVRAAADELGVHPETLHRWIRKGQVRVYRVGTKALRVDLAELRSDFLKPTR
jgi:excisionase family DNA binding protein